MVSTLSNKQWWSHKGVIQYVRLLRAATLSLLLYIRVLRDDIEHLQAYGPNRWVYVSSIHLFIVANIMIEIQCKEKDMVGVPDCSLPVCQSDDVRIVRWGSFSAVLLYCLELYMDMSECLQVVLHMYRNLDCIVNLHVPDV